MSWSANAEPDLAGYNIYRGTSSPVATTGTPLNGGTLLTTPLFTDVTAANGTTYVYAVTARDTATNQSASTEVSATPNAFAGASLQLNGSSQYATFGQADGLAGLGASTFTLETWIKRTGAGIATPTSGSTSAIPLITKGMAQADAPANVNLNYFLGLDPATGRLFVDFEDTVNGANHPFTGATAIPVSTTAWHHVAATFDGTLWRLYVDGVLDATSPTIAFTPEFNSIQHAAIGTALQTGGTVSGQTWGYFAGLMDEVRIWDHARSQVEIQASMNIEVTSAPGLIGRWGLNDATGTTAANSARPAIPGALVGTPIWSGSYPFPPDTTPPDPPAGLAAAPGNGQVSLTWTANTEPDLAGYRVYRGTASGSYGAPLNGTLLTSPSYVDTTVTNDTPYFYAVTAVDIFGNQSTPSNEATATPSSNLPPVVNAGPDQTVPFATPAALTGTVTDDGSVTVLWSQTSGPGVTAFANAAATATTVSFDAAGAYVLRLTANDGTYSTFDELTITVADPVLVGAGDIAPNCNAGGNLTAATATSLLLSGQPGTVFTLGDNAYENGTASEFANCYDPTWGPHKARTRPVSGNHDYNTAGATGYYDYFNGVGVQNGPAGDRTIGGYYSYNVGKWHVVVLNSECTSLWNSSGCAAGSAQEQWLRADLAASPTNNIIAMWHRPFFSSSGGHANLQPLYQALYDFGVDIVLGGHWHNYERLAPANPAGVADAAFGIRSFVIGTGGIPLTGFGTTHGVSEVRNSTTHGVMKFTLHDSSYDWEFIPIAGQSFTDSGTSAVHGPPSGNVAPTVAAGPDQTVNSGAANLAGVVSDDGLVSALTTTWSKVSGPGIVTFGNAAAPVTSAGFTAVGTYVLQLTANDGQFVRSDTVTITVTAASGNLPPVVDAGANQTITLPAQASLVGSVTDDGLPGPDVTSLWTVVGGPGTVTFNDATSTATTASFSLAGTYVLRLTATDTELTGFDEVTVTVNPAAVNNAIDFGGTNAYVTFGAAPGLGVTTMTLEAWFRRDGAGGTAQTGSGGVTATPLIAKGRNESDGSNVDMNYFFGIDASGRLVADFEDTALGTNRPSSPGATTIPIGPTWHHAAATYDGTTWRLYLDGVLDQTTVIGGFTPRSDSIQHAAIGSALNSTGVPNGFFDGAIDEVRIWDRALTLAEIQTNANQQITSASNLVARWGLNEGAGIAVGDSTAGPVNGTVTGASYLWAPGAPFNLTFNQAPDAPLLVTPGDGATGLSTAPTLAVTVADGDADPLSVTFYGRAAAAPAPNFTLVALPDTQHYVDDPGRAATFTAQTQWILNNQTALNIPFVTHLGDITENIDAQPIEWTRANTSLSLLDGQVPYGLAPGNHDLNSSGVGTYFDLTFPVSRYSGNAWYGGYLGQNLFSFTDPVNRENKNNFELFSAGGMDFIIIHLEYDMPDYSVAWAQRVLAAYPTRRAIISTHLFLNASGSRPSTVLNRANGTPASAVWSNLVFPNCNVFLVLNGHYPGEANRTDNNSCGQPVHQLASDYQSRTNGGDGWLRYMTFKPAENKIEVFTYSPTLNSGAGQFETDSNSQFVLTYNMSGAAFTAIGTNTNVPSGTDTNIQWPGRAANTTYEWYATVSDGQQTVVGPTWSFTTAPAANQPPTATPQSVSTPEDTALGITLAGTDPENDPLSFVVATGPTNGILSGAAPNLIYTPNANFTGGDSFTFTVNDGTSTSTPATVSIDVTPVNDAPVAVDDLATTPEDTAVAIAAATLLANDTDLDGDTLSVTAVGTAVNGTVSLASGVVTFTPAANYTGVASFEYTVSDGALTDTGLVTVTVTGANDAPVAVDDLATTPEDTAVAIAAATLLANDTDLDGDTLSVTAVGTAVNGTVSLVSGVVTFTPAANYTGAASFEYTVSDGALTDTGLVTVTVTGANDPPVAVDDSRDDAGRHGGGHRRGDAAGE